MGLDMYVTAKRYLWSFEDADKSKKDAIQSLFPEMAGAEPKQVEFESIYWRKANHIHKWFVDNVQDGVDECQESYLNAEDLRNLQTVCEAVLADRSRAEELLPTGKGFFFGGTEYDDWYYDTVERTLKWLNGLLIKDALDDKFKQWSFYYQASW